MWGGLGEMWGIRPLGLIVGSTIPANQPTSQPDARLTAYWIGSQLGYGPAFGMRVGLQRPQRRKHQLSIHIASSLRNITLPPSAGSNRRNLWSRHVFSRASCACQRKQLPSTVLVTAPDSPSQLDSVVTACRSDASHMEPDAQAAAAVPQAMPSRRKPPRAASSAPTACCHCRPAVQEAMSELQVTAYAR